MVLDGRLGRITVDRRSAHRLGPARQLEIIVAHAAALLDAVER
jgi:hypothetical protein